MSDESAVLRLAGVGARSAGRIFDAWGLDEAGRCALLDVGPEDCARLVSTGAAPHPSGLAERTSFILGVYKNLHLIFGDHDRQKAWLVAPNTDVPFLGTTPLATMRRDLAGLRATRRYLDAWAAGN